MLVLAWLATLAPASLLAQEPTSASEAQRGPAASTTEAAFRSKWPELHDLLDRLERAHGVMYGALVRNRGHVDEAEVQRAMRQRLDGPVNGATPDAEAERGYQALGPRAAALIRRAQAFHREVLAIFAEVEASQREQALDAAVERYASDGAPTLPDVPKDMSILYEHTYTPFVEENFVPKRKQPYPSLTGLVWAGHWFRLAAQEPLEVGESLDEQRQGVSVVTERFRRKLSGGKPPDAFPSELPLAPSIAPGLISAHLRASAIIDNLNMFHDVLADVLVHPKVSNVQAAIDEVVQQFTDRGYRFVEVDDWITMALRHSIFAQGGPALRTMTQSDRNGSGHVQHTRGSRSIPPGGMR